MCGRTVQSQSAVLAASSGLSRADRQGISVVDEIGPRITEDSHGEIASSSANSVAEESDDLQSQLREEPGSYPWRDNFNLSPGHDAVVFTMEEDGAIHMSRKVWGLIPKNGTENNPLPRGASKHFSNLMFNARSDTLFSKPTFSRLLNQRKTCLVAFDGFFEWKADALAGGKGKKQPFYIYPKQVGNDKLEKKKKQPEKYLLMAGLWDSVTTGWPEQPRLDTFTILTTEVCDPLKWLHTRMPVCVWDEKLALEWLKQPSQKIENELQKGANGTEGTLIQWHAVTPKMSSTKYRSLDSIKAIPKPKSVKSFFKPLKETEDQLKSEGGKREETKNNADVSSSEFRSQSNKPTGTSPLSSYVSKKRPAPGSPSLTSPTTESKSAVKKSRPSLSPKKGTITSFFAPKQNKS